MEENLPGKQWWLLGILLLVLMAAPDAIRADHGQEAIERIQDAVQVFDEIMSVPDKAIPRDLLDKASCMELFQV